MAFGEMKRYGVENSDMVQWASCNEAKVFAHEIEILRDQAFRAILKDGQKFHDKNAESYKAYERLIAKLNEATNLR